MARDDLLRIHRNQFRLCNNLFCETGTIAGWGQPITVEALGYACPAFADINRDCLDDLIVGQYKDGKLKVYLRQPDGSLGSGQWLKTGDKVAVVPGVW